MVFFYHVSHLGMKNIITVLWSDALLIWSICILPLLFYYMYYKIVSTLNHLAPFCLYKNRNIDVFVLKKYKFPGINYCFEGVFFGIKVLKLMQRLDFFLICFSCYNCVAQVALNVNIHVTVQRFCWKDPLNFVNFVVMHFDVMVVAKIHVDKI